jgi:hypothetical protein
MDISNQEFFKVMSVQFFTVFAAHHPLFRTFLEIMDRSVIIFS